MRPAAFALVAASAGLFAAACFDLFHSTSDVLTACDIDASTPGCVAPATAVPSLPDAGETDFCTWTPDKARARAQHACAWLGACETPMGRNAFGSCMFQAQLAYDCEANPNHRVKGKSHSLWDCLSQVKRCGDVDSCVFPEGPTGCEPAASYTACGAGADAMASNADVRFECIDGGVARPNAYGENCALWGQTCASNGSAAFCAGMAGLTCGSAKACLGDPRAQLQWCVDGGDKGIDCADNGGQLCVAFPDAAHPWLACAVESDAGPCLPDPSAACVNGVALSCPTGTLETIDCASVLQSDAGCEPGALAPPFDWTSPCAVVPSGCTESCAGTSLTGCARGAAFTLDCTTEGLGPCRMVTTDMGSAEHAACAPP
jgi:hypothetical protein